MKTLKNNQFERMKKGAVATLCVLMLAGSLFSCKNASEDEEELPFVSCPCYAGKPMVPWITWEKKQKVIEIDALLFKDYFSYWEYGRSEETPFPSCCSLILESKINLVYLNCFCFELDMPSLSSSKICNFPDFAKEWEIPDEGLLVHLAGKYYWNCEGTSYMIHERTTGDNPDNYNYIGEVERSFAELIVLTHLKRI